MLETVQAGFAIADLASRLRATSGDASARAFYDEVIAALWRHSATLERSLGADEAELVASYRRFLQLQAKYYEEPDSIASRRALSLAAAAIAVELQLLANPSQTGTRSQHGG